MRVRYKKIAIRALIEFCRFMLFCVCFTMPLVGFLILGREHGVMPLAIFSSACVVCYGLIKSQTNAITLIDMNGYGKITSKGHKVIQRMGDTLND